MQTNSDTLDLGQALEILRRRAPLIALCVALIGGAAFVLARHESKKYTATSAIEFGSDSLSGQIAGLASAPSSVGSLLAQRATNVELVRLGNLAARTAHALGNGLSYEQVAASVSIEERGESGVVAVSATSASPRRAAAIANTYARLFVREQQRANRAYFRSALNLVEKQLQDLSPQQRVGADGLQLQERAQTLRLLSELGYGNVNLAQKAATPTAPSSPNVSRDTVLGLALGLLVGLGLAFLLEHFDHRIRRSEELEAIYGRPIVGFIPKSRALSANGPAGAALPAPEAEAFALTRAQLHAVNSCRELCCLAIASPAPGDGNTTIARHLAGVAARGGSRVLLLEGDLRRPVLADRLGIDPASGLSDVLSGRIAVEEAVQHIVLDVSSMHSGRRRTLDVIAAGSVLLAAPAELIENDAIDAVLTWARRVYDLVVVDAPPLTAVSDGFYLLGKVDAVVVVGKIGFSRKDAAEQLHQLLARSGASLLGVIANGVKPRAHAAPGYLDAGARVATRPVFPLSSPREELAPAARL
jgi:tyrosine-protein kinase